VTLSDGSHIAYGYDTSGNLVSATDATGTIALTYNAANELTSVTYPTGLSLEYSYDSGGQRTKMVELSGTTITSTVLYEYNAAGELSSLTNGTGAAIVSYTYNKVGQLVEQKLANGTYTTYQYNKDGELEDLANYASGGTVSSSFDYTYDALGNVTSMATLDGTWTYTYDTTGQLATSSFASTDVSIPSQSLTYQYNAAGNLVGTVVNGVSSTYTSNSDDQYTTVTSANGTTIYTYNSDGDLVSQTDASGTTTYTYDSLNRLVSVTSPTDTWVYEYDALGDLSATIHNGQVTEYLIDPTGQANVVGQYDGSGNLLANYTYGLGLVSQITPGGTNYYAFDGLGSTVGLTNSAGATVSSYSYLPFGGVLSSTGTTTNSAGNSSNPFTFVGQYGASTDGTGLTQMGARFYDQAIGQFVTSDPLGLTSGQTNFYEYVANSPTNGIDPSGLIAQFFGAGGGTIAAGDLGLSFNASGEESILAGFAGTSAAVTFDSFSANLASPAASPDASGTLGAEFPGVSSINTITPTGITPTVTAGVGFHNPTAALLGPTTIPIGTLDSLLGLKTTPNALRSQPATTHVLLEGDLEEDVNVPVPQRKVKSLVVLKGGSSGGGQPAIDGNNGAAGVGIDSPTGVDGQVGESGNTQTGGPGGAGGGYGNSANDGNDGNSGGPGNSGSPGSSGKSGSPGAPGSGSSSSSSSTTPSSTQGGKTAGSYDPNAKIGPAGYGTANYVSGSSLSLYPYEIQFENSPTATAPAQQVTITDQLDPNLDLSTFQLTGIGFGDTVLTIPPGSQMYQTTVSMTYNNETFDVVIEAGLNYSTGQVYAKFQSIDPDTQLPPDVLTGFLPPENGTGRGEGYVSYIISPKPGIANGTVIRNVAVITFDSNPPLSTDEVNDDDPGLGIDPTKQDPITVVTVPPSSSVSPLPATMSSPTFTVSWSGQDPGGPGIASYNISNSRPWVFLLKRRLFSSPISQCYRT
jgi:RHS repeat-associated protein